MLMAFGFLIPPKWYTRNLLQTHIHIWQTNQDKTHKKINKSKNKKQKKREDKKQKIKRLLIVKQRLKTRNDKQIFLINVFEHV